MKKQVLAVAAATLLAMGTLGSGCKQLNAEGMAGVATQDLGVPVFLWALDGDVCATRQLKALFEEFGKTNAAGRAALSARVKQTYNGIVVLATLATKELGDLTGELKVLQLQDGHRHVLNSKNLVDTRDNSAHQLAGTQVDKGDVSSVEGKVLSLRPNHSEDKSEKSLYVTTDSATFDAVGATGTPNALSLEDALSAGRVYQSAQVARDADPCGKLATLEDIL